METIHETLFEEDDEAKGSVALAEVNFDLVETGRWLLKVIGGPNNGAEFSMHQHREYIVGADPTLCDIVLQDTSVSRQHAKITIHMDDTLSIEDLNSRNGILIEGERIEEPKDLPLQTIITLGTTLFVVYDREKELQTILSPLSPSIMEELPPPPPEESLPDLIEDVSPPLPADLSWKDLFASWAEQTTLLIVAIVTATLLGVGILIGIIQLFSSPKHLAHHEALTTKQAIAEILDTYPAVEFRWQEDAGQLFLFGHILLGVDRQQLTHLFQALPAIKQVDDKGLMIDEYILREVNPILSRHPAWKQVILHAPEAGHFVLTGYLPTRQEAHALFSYLDTQFSYLQKAERRLVVEEEVIQQLENELTHLGIFDVRVHIAQGEVSFTGTVPYEKNFPFHEILLKAKSLLGVRDVHSYVSLEAPSSPIRNVTDQYSYAGMLRGENLGVTPIIDGKFLSVGSYLDGRKVIQIRPDHLLMEDEEGRLYQIDY